MKVKVLLFASLREVVGAPQSTLDVEQGANISDVWHDLAGLYPPLAPHTGTIAFALNGSYAKPNETVKDGDEIAFLPPVSGG
jgi:molybdopterin converting factor subunit 1